MQQVAKIGLIIIKGVFTAVTLQCTITAKKGKLMVLQWSYLCQAGIKQTAATEVFHTNLALSHRALRMKITSFQFQIWYPVTEYQSHRNALKGFVCKSMSLQWPLTFKLESVHPWDQIDHCTKLKGRYPQAFFPSRGLLAASGHSKWLELT